MQKVKIYKCPACNRPYTSLGAWCTHMQGTHPNNIPKGYTPERYFYYILTGKTHGNCIQCKRPTKWNDVTLKYERFCGRQECTDEYIAICNKRIIGKYGKTKSVTINANGKAHLLNNPDQQRKMVSNRSISGTYKFEDGGEKTFVGSNEKEFLTMIDTFLHLDSKDILAPSPHTYYYEYKNPNDKEHEGTKFYIPDAYIVSLNLEIEIKESTNMHPKIVAVDRVKERLKDELMKSNPTVNYIKILDNDFSNFFEYFLKLKEEIPNEDIPKNIYTTPATEAVCVEDIFKEMTKNSFSIFFKDNEPSKPLYKINNFFQYAKATAVCEIKKDTYIAKNVAWGSIDCNLNKMKLTDIANAVTANPESEIGNIKFIKRIEGIQEIYDLIATRDIKIGEVFKYNSSLDMPDFFTRV